MSNGHTAVSEFLRDKERFADYFNGNLFQGQQIVTPKGLEVVKGESDILLEDKNLRTKNVHRYRDIVMRWNGEVHLAILACEIQSKVHYAMPVRNMLYDGLTYLEQTKKVWEMRRTESEEKLSGAEYLSRFGKDDKLIPVITSVFYYGTDIWDGSINLHGMFQEEFLQNELVRKYVPNYTINLVDASHIEDVDCFQSDLKEIFGMMQHRQDKDALIRYMDENRAYFSHVDGGTYRAIGGLLQSKQLLNRMVQRKEEEEVDMCKALDDLYQEGVTKGVAQGVAQGEREKLASQVKRKLELGQSEERIAEDLLEEIDTIREIKQNYLQTP